MNWKNKKKVHLKQDQLIVKSLNLINLPGK